MLIPITSRYKNISKILTFQTASRIFKGQSVKGQSGEEAELEWEKFPYMAMLKVRSLAAL